MICRNCGLDSAYEGCDDCLKCVVATEIHEGYDHLPVWRKLHAGTEWLAKIEQEFTRQKTALEAM